MGILIHSYDNYCGGIGDLFRSIITWIVLCKENGIDMYIDFTAIPFFENCFQIKKYHKEYPSNAIYVLKLDMINVDEFYTTLLTQLKEPNACIILTSNCCKKITPNTKEFNTYVQPSESIEEMLQYYYEEYRLDKKKYYSFHLRCGDTHIANQTIQIDDKKIEQYDALIQNMQLDYPVIIHSDSESFKIKMKEKNPSYIILDTQIQHVADKHGMNTVTSFLSTVAEFYCIAYSAGVIMPIYSGFSHIASLVGEIPLYTDVKNYVLDYLGHCV